LAAAVTGVRLRIRQEERIRRLGDRAMGLIAT
jgi:hypothetical protein